jgi:predicted ATPase/DNA-binding winged helix-turn-helix (wHTH) protein
MDGHAISFGPFRLLAAQRLLLEGDRPVRLGSRAFDILTTLVERAGEVVSKEALLARAWPQTFVEESNLKIQVSALRRALGDGQGGHRYVLTIPGRGYNFVAPIALERAPQTPAATIAPPAAGLHNLPHAITRMIGRENAAAAITSRLSHERLVTVVGPGGIGKTTVALAVAEQMIRAYEHGVWLVDLAPLNHPHLVASTVAAVLGLEIHAVDPLPALSAALGDRRMLLLLDNCEHVAEEAANLAQALLSGAGGVSILATSREPLRVVGEREYRLGPLGSPQNSSTLTAAEAETFPAVQLFVERASAIVEDFMLTDANAPLIVEICRRLDGLPLAIEFAAPRVEVLGVEALAARLDLSLPLLGAQRRSAIPRHRTMQTVLNWSYGLLTEDERSFFRFLGIFAGGFTVEAATAVVMEPATTPYDAIDRLADLVAKSLIVADVGGAHPRFRLLDTIRVYALEKLHESGDHERIALRRAEHYRQLLDRPDGKTTRPGAQWLSDCALEIDNVRAALDWSFSSSAHATIGIELTAAYVPVWMDLSLAAECRQRCERALLQLKTHQISDDRLRMQLQIGLGNSMLHTLGPSEQAQTVLTEALGIADALNDLQAQLRILLGLSSVRVYRGEYARGAAEVERAAEIAHRVGDISAVVAAERRMGITLLTTGRLMEAQQYLERAIQSPFYPENERSTVRQRSGDRAMARAALGRALWLQGFADRARREAQASLDDVGGSDLTMCRVIYLGVGRIAPMIGDFDAAGNAISNLIELASRVNVPFWMTAGQFLRGKLLVERRDFAEGLAVLRDAFEMCRRTGWRLSYPEFTGSLALALSGLGQLDEAYDAVTDAIESAGGAADGQRWYVPELLRIKAEVLFQQGSEPVSVAENCLDQAVAMAGEQGALFWELRIALSLCRLRLTQGRSDEGRQELASVYDRFTEGFDTADMIAAKLLLDDPRSADRE